MKMKNLGSLALLLMVTISYVNYDGILYVVSQQCQNNNEV